MQKNVPATKQLMPFKTEIKLLRKDSYGVPGSISNAKHHAPVILPFIDAMKDEVGNLGFATWKQGNNVHEFITADGRKFTLRAYSFINAYAGVRLSLRVSRTLEYMLIDIDSLDDVPKLLDTMRLLAVPQRGDDTGVMLSKQPI